jgi:DNA-binding response OmpR family regulator
MAEVESVRRSVLLVEDNMDTADSLARFLRIAAGFDVRVAYDGQAGFRSAVKDPPDAVICDLGLPKVDGLQLAAELVAELDPKPLLIAFTAYTGEYTEAKARAAGFDHYVAKPADPFVLERLIQTNGSRS